MACNLIPMMTSVNNDINFENRSNIAMAGNIAAWAILWDASHCIKIYVAGVWERKDSLSNNATKKHQRLACKQSICYVLIHGSHCTCLRIHSLCGTDHGVHRGYSQDITTGNKDWCTMNGHVPDGSCIEQRSLGWWNVWEWQYQCLTCTSQSWEVDKSPREVIAGKECDKTAAC